VNKISQVLCLVFSLMYAAKATPIIIEGKVRHANTYQEIPFVNIYIKNSPIGTYSEMDGSFKLSIPDSIKKSYLVFEHVAYDTLQLNLASAAEQSNYYLYPRVIQSPSITIQAQRDKPAIVDDLPQPYSIISAKNFDTQGYMDAGDLLRKEQSIQVDEELSGKKTIAIRGGNSDDVIVLYNGIKMNSAYDNVFDLSLINIEDVRQFEIIRGSNTSLYGPEAFSGVINVIPKIYKNYNVRFIQRFGTYASGDWSLQLNHTFGNKLNLAYSYKQGATKREYSNGDSQENEILNNEISNHSANIIYDLTKHPDDPEKNISLVYLRSTLDHSNEKYDEDLANINQMISLRYVGNIWKFNALNITGAYQNFDREQNLVLENGTIQDRYANRNFNLNFEKRITFERLKLILAYQYENGELDYKDDRNIKGEQNIGIESALFAQQNHGIASIFKFHIPTMSDFLTLADLDLSYRYDYVANDQKDVIYRPGTPLAFVQFDPDQAKNNNWSESTYKFSTQFVGEHRFFRMNSYINFGSNVKFPTLFQQISSPLSTGPNNQATQPNLNPEKNRSLEIGIDLIKETNDTGTLNGWELDFNYFRNYYDNKFRTYYSPGIPIAFFDNVQNADIFGIETTAKLFMVKKKITMELGTSKYTISEKAAFPFKSDLKYIMNFSLDHAGYSLQLHGFKESEQVAWVRNLRGEYWEVNLPGYANMDVHFGKKFDVHSFKLFLNLSARNIFDDDTLLEGIAIRDRRFYISFGAQY
jgi:outer membrane cobalamin receptor